MTDDLAAEIAVLRDRTIPMGSEVEQLRENVAALWEAIDRLVDAMTNNDCGVHGSADQHRE